jgi:hypothetical protein
MAEWAQLVAQAHQAADLVNTAVEAVVATVVSPKSAPVAVQCSAAAAAAPGGT